MSFLRDLLYDRLLYLLMTPLEKLEHVSMLACLPMLPGFMLRFTIRDECWLNDVAGMLQFRVKWRWINLKFQVAEPRQQILFTTVHCSLQTYSTSLHLHEIRDVL